MTDRAETIKVIRSALRQRSGKTWSVTGGRGTAWGWLTITAPPARRAGSSMTVEDQTELAGLLGVPFGLAGGGVMVAASHDHWRGCVDRARGRNPPATSQPYVDCRRTPGRRRRPGGR